MSLILFESCAQQTEDSNKMSIDIVTDKFDEEELNKLIEEEYNKYEEFRKNSNCVIVKNGFLDSKISSNKDLIHGIDVRGINDQINSQLLNPYRKGIITSDQLLEIVYQLNDEQMEDLIYNLEFYPVKSLNGNIEFLDLIFDSDFKINAGENVFLLKVLYQYPEFENEVNDSLGSKLFFENHNYYADKIVSRYSLSGDQKGTLKYLNLLIENDIIITESWDYHLTAFEHLFIYGDNHTKAQAKELLFKYLSKHKRGFHEFQGMLWNETSDEFKKLVVEILEYHKILGNEPIDSRLHHFSYFNIRYYIRLYGFESKKLIEKLLSISNKSKKYDNKNIFFDISNKEEYEKLRLGVRALNTLVKTNTLTKNEKQQIIEIIKKFDIHHCKDFRYTIVNILAELYPSKRLKDFENISADIIESSNPWMLESMWETAKFNNYNLSDFFIDFTNFGFDTTNVSKLDKYVFSKQENYYDVNVLNAFKLISESIHYDCETGLRVNPYDDLLTEYVNLCSSELPDYKPYFSYNY